MQEIVDIYSKAGVSIFTHNELLVIGISSCKNHPVSNVLKLKVELSYDLEIPTPGHVSRQNSHSKRYLHHYAHHITSHNSQDKKQSKCPMTDEWIKKMWYIYTMEYYSVIKENEIVPLSATRMDLDSDYHTTWNQRKTSITYHLYVEYKIQYKWTYLHK